MSPASPVFISRHVGEVVFAKDQPEYEPLPAVVGTDAARTVTTRWRLTWGERVAALLFGDVWHEQLTYGDRLQPIRMGLREPE